MTLSDPFPIGRYADGTDITISGTGGPRLTTGGKTDLTDDIINDTRSALPAITDPQQLAGFTLLDGLLLSLIGEDGDRVVIIGHHEQHIARVTVAAFLRTMDYDEPVQAAYDGHYEEKFGRFTPDPDSTSDNWWCDWTGTEPHPDRIAITLIDIE